MKTEHTFQICQESEAVCPGILILNSFKVMFSFVFHVCVCVRSFKAPPRVGESTSSHLISPPGMSLSGIMESQARSLSLSERSTMARRSADVFSDAALSALREIRKVPLNIKFFHIWATLLYTFRILFPCLFLPSSCRQVSWDRLSRLSYRA